MMASSLRRWRAALMPLLFPWLNGQAMQRMQRD
jgi:hypothetical protein